MPSAFSMTFAVLPSITATHELVVPRSIPMTFPMVLTSLFLRQVGWALTAHQSKPPTIKYSRYCDGEPHIGQGGRPARTGAQPSPAKNPNLWKIVTASGTAMGPARRPHPRTDANSGAINAGAGGCPITERTAG